MLEKFVDRGAAHAPSCGSKAGAVGDTSDAWAGVSAAVGPVGQEYIKDPAVSQAQRRFFGMCEHDPGASADCPKGMTHAQMHDFAATKDKGLPEHVKKEK